MDEFAFEVLGFIVTLLYTSWVLWKSDKENKENKKKIEELSTIAKSLGESNYYKKLKIEEEFKPEFKIAHGLYNGGERYEEFKLVNIGKIAKNIVIVSGGKGIWVRYNRPEDYDQMTGHYFEEDKVTHECGTGGELKIYLINPNNHVAGLYNIYIKFTDINTLVQYKQKISIIWENSQCFIDPPIPLRD